jgi:lipopolysaccharide cholinephosphotransferase
LIYLNTVKHADLAGLLHARKSFIGKARILLYKLLPFSKTFIQKRLPLLYQKYDASPTGLVGITMSCDNPFDTYPANFFEEYVDVEFEGRTFKAIRQYDKWLRICYGDYMQLPPVEKRVGRHHITAYYK